MNINTQDKIIKNTLLFYQLVRVDFVTVRGFMELFETTGVFDDQFPLAAKQIGDYAGDLAVWSRFGPLLHLCFDLLKTTRYHLLTCVQELTPVHFGCHFHIIWRGSMNLLQVVIILEAGRKSRRMSKVASTAPMALSISDSADMLTCVQGDTGRTTRMWLSISRVRGGVTPG